jgi:hypothetical protein
LGQSSLEVELCKAPQIQYICVNLPRPLLSYGVTQISLLEVRGMMNSYYTSAIFCSSVGHHEGRFQNDRLDAFL